MLYASQYLSLACLEILVHVDKTQLPRDLVYSSTEIPVAGVLRFDNLSDLELCQSTGEEWLKSGNELAVCVPSVAVPREFNVLLNPAYPDYNSLVWLEPEPFGFDPRLFTDD